MSNYYKNWIFIDIKKFLVINDFKLLRQKGSHVHFYKKVHGKTFLVTVPFHGKQSLKIKTMKNVIDNSQIDKEKWFEFKK